VARQDLVQGKTKTAIRDACEPGAESENEEESEQGEKIMTKIKHIRRAAKQKVRRRSISLWRRFSQCLKKIALFVTVVTTDSIGERE
jgi:hypothetical protein